MKKFLLLSFFIIFYSPFLLQSQACISDVFVEPVDCQPGGTVFTGLLFFQHSPNVDTVSVYYDGNFFGNHPSANQPIVLFPLFLTEIRTL